MTKSKTGLVEKTRPTKHWTDWVDYWAVDFDYLQRREIIKVPVGSGLTASRPASSHRKANWPWPPSRNAGLATTSSKMNGKVFGLARTATPPPIYAKPGRYAVAVNPH
jgi:hypothetical protein